jgi:3-oxoadipate enol-lactonase/4-carboxymuconolactone decarboxylase
MAEPTLAWSEQGVAGGTPVVLLNSIGTSTAMWTPCLAPLRERYRLISIDHPGHGDSAPSPAGTTLDVADLGRAVLRVLDQLGIARAHIAGLSLGAMTAMWLAIHHPARVDRLALLCSTAAPENRDGYRARAELVREQGMAAVVDAVVPLWVTAGLLERDQQLRRRLATMLTSVDAESYAQCCELVAALDLRADLARIASPTLVVAAEQDPATPPEHAERIAAGIAGAQLQVLHGAAHLATVEQPGQIGQLLIDHLGSDGNRNRRQVLGDAHVDRAIAATTEFTAGFQSFISRYAWGEVWGRPGLSRRERSIATLTALVALGAEHELAMHVRGAVNNGLTAAEIGEVLLHTAVYAGVPRANRAFAIADRTLAELAAAEEPHTAGNHETEENA